MYVLKVYRRRVAVRDDSLSEQKAFLFSRSMMCCRLQQGYYNVWLATKTPITLIELQGYFPAELKGVGVFTLLLTDLFSIVDRMWSQVGVASPGISVPSSLARIHSGFSISTFCCSSIPSNFANSRPRTFTDMIKKAQKIVVVFEPAMYRMSMALT